MAQLYYMRMSKSLLFIKTMQVRQYVIISQCYCIVHFICRLHTRNSVAHSIIRHFLILINPSFFQLTFESFIVICIAHFEPAYLSVIIWTVHLSEIRLSDSRPTVNDKCADNLTSTGTQT